MTPIKTIVRKEFRQQGSLAAGMVLLCLLLQLIPVISSLFSEKGFATNISADTFLGVALLITALYAGAAAALSFSTEHDEKTFHFLRSLPISPMTVMFGKAIWICIGTVCVLVVALFLTLIFGLAVSPDFGNNNVIGAFGVGILEALVWGLFWSPRCRSQIHALLITYFSASLSSFIAVQFYQSGDVLDSYNRAVPIRLAIAGVVALLAVWEMLQWFNYAREKRGQFRLWNTLTFCLNSRLFRYPKKRQSPFFALLHHSIRQSGTLLLCGVAASSFVCLNMIRYFGKSDSYYLSFDMGFLSCLGFYMMIYCGCIFGQDQKNNSFRFLSRCGITAGQVWWSRILPFLVIVLPVLLTLIFFFLHSLDHSFYSYRKFDPISYKLLGVFTCIWLVPFAVGSFLSISMRSMVVASALTGAGTLLIGFWMGFGITMFGFSPFWTTLPICITLLVASRLRTADWLREKRTWRSRLVPLIPLFVTVSVIFLAIPPVRIYSIPYVSFAEIEAEMNSLKVLNKLDPEKRQKLFRETEARLLLPITKEDLEKFHNERTKLYDDLYESRLKVKDRASLSLIEQYKADIKIYDSHFEQEEAFEDRFLSEYELYYRGIRSGFPGGLDGRSSSPDKLVIFMFNHFPGERERLLRLLNDTALSQLKAYKKGATPDYHYANDFTTGLVNIMSFQIVNFYGTEFFAISRLKQLELEYVKMALHCWYLEHDNTLPESLDQLVGVYIKAIPTDPLTGRQMLYQSKWDWKTIEKRKTGGGPTYGLKPGWPYILIGDKFDDLEFLPGYDD